MMASNSTDRVKAYRKRLYEDEDAHEEAKKKDKERKRLKRLEIKNNKHDSIKQQNKNTSYQKAWRAMKKAKGQAVIVSSPCKYPSPQSLGKAVSRALKTMPKSPTKAAAVVDCILKKMSPTKRVPLLLQHLKAKNIQNLDRKKRSDAVSDRELEDATNFYERNDISYLLPGRKDYKSIKNADGKRICIQKRVLLYNLKEVHALYKAGATENTMGFVKFTTLRPQHVMLSGESDQEVCMCEYHENLNLCIQGIKKKISTLPDSTTELLTKTVCSFDNESCIDRQCEYCGVNYLDPYLDSVNEDTPVSYFQWITRDGQVRKEVVETDLAEGKQILKEQLNSFARHIYNVKWQHENLRYLKDNLMDGEIIIQEDFAENYSLKQQNEIMKAHWSPEQVTVFTAIVYHEVGQELKHISYAIVSDVLTHGKKEVFAFNKIILEDVKEKLKKPFQHVYYWSDGCGSQFKNKYNLGSNMIHHKEDHGCTASWNFFATAHGKGPVDGIGAEVKRSVWYCTMQKKDVPSNAYDFYGIAKREAKSINILFVPKLEVVATVEEFKLEIRWQAVKSIPSTRRMHSFHVANGEVFAEVNSMYIEKRDSGIQRNEKSLHVHHALSTSTTQSISKPDLEEGTWIAVLYSNDWWPGQVIKMLPEEKLLVKFELKPISTNKFKTMQKAEFEEIDLGTYLSILPGDPPPIDSSARFFAYDKEIARKVESVIETIEQ